jgi:hypothetical protein
MSLWWSGLIPLQAVSNVVWALSAMDPPAGAQCGGLWAAVARHTHTFDARGLSQVRFSYVFRGLYASCRSLRYGKRSIGKELVIGTRWVRLSQFS